MGNAGVEAMEEEIGLASVFPEEERPPSPEPTSEIYIRQRDGQESSPDDEKPVSWSKLTIHLVGSHPLWGQLLWNAARSFAGYLDRIRQIYEGRCVLELGAGGGLPGLVTALNGAKKVVLTDYPDQPLLDNLERNIRENIPPELRPNVHVEGLIWGKPVKDVLQYIASPASSHEDGTVSRLPEREIGLGAGPGFDLIILSDLIFNHSQHDALLSTCEQALRARDASPVACMTGETQDSGKPDQDNTISVQDAPQVLVFFTHHRPHMAQRDMDFFEKARTRGWETKKLLTEVYKPMFAVDSGDPNVRATVHGWRLTRTLNMPLQS